MHLKSLTLATLLIALPAVPGETDYPPTEGLIRAENSASDGWLRKYDYIQHQDLGRLTSDYFRAYTQNTPEHLVRDGLLPADAPVAALKAAWRQRPVRPEPEPFAVDWIARDGEVRAVTFTRVVFNGTMDSYVLEFEYSNEKWVIDTDGLTGSGLKLE